MSRLREAYTTDKVIGPRQKPKRSNPVSYPDRQAELEFVIMIIEGIHDKGCQPGASLYQPCTSYRCADLRQNWLQNQLPMSWNTLAVGHLMRRFE